MIPRVIYAIVFIRLLFSLDIYSLNQLVFILKRRPVFERRDTLVPTTLDDWLASASVPFLPYPPHWRVGPPIQYLGTFMITTRPLIIHQQVDRPLPANFWAHGPCWNRCTTPASGLSRAGAALCRRRGRRRQRVRLREVARLADDMLRAQPAHPLEHPERST